MSVFHRDFKRDLDFNEWIKPEELKAYPLFLDTELTDPQINEIIYTVGTFIQNAITRPIIHTPTTSEKMGNDQDTLRIDYPINSLLKITEKYRNYNKIVDLTMIHISSISNDGRPLYRPSIKRLNDLWSSECLYIIDYTTGELVFPRKIKTAVFIAAANFISKIENRNIKSIRVSDVQITYDKSIDCLSDEVLILLEDWTGKQLIV